MSAREKEEKGTLESSLQRNGRIVDHGEHGNVVGIGTIGTNQVGSGCIVLQTIVVFLLPTKIRSRERLEQ